jgi:hypothetical protein
MEAKISRGSWCLAFGFDPMPTLEQVVKVLSAFGYDGIELAGFFDHATVEKYPDEASRKKLVQWITEEHGLELVGYAPGPYGDFGRLPWATGSADVVAEYEKCFEEYLGFCVDCGIPSMRVDPGDFGPLAHDADYDKVWDRVVTTFRQHAQRGRGMRGSRPQPGSAAGAPGGRPARVRRDDEGQDRPHARLRHRLEYLAQRIRHASRDRQGDRRLRCAHPSRRRCGLHEQVVVGGCDPDERGLVGRHVE